MTGKELKSDSRDCCHKQDYVKPSSTILGLTHMTPNHNRGAPTHPSVYISISLHLCWSESCPNIKGHLRDCVLPSYDHLSSVLVSVTVEGHQSLRARYVVWEKDRCRGEAGGHCVLCVLRRLFRSRLTHPSRHHSPAFLYSIQQLCCDNHKINDLKRSTLPRFLHNHVTIQYTSMYCWCVDYFYT